MSKLKEIIDGWGNYVFPNPKIEIAAKARARICSDCMYNDGSKCTKCGCVLAAKTRSPNSVCPLKKWGRIKNV